MKYADPIRLRRLRRLVHVPRWTTIPTIRKQSVGEHSFQVAVIAVWLLEAMHGIELESSEEASGIVAAAVFHDEAEAVTGDLPSPLKRALRGSIETFEAQIGADLRLPDRVAALLKLADLLEALLFIREEQSMGNGMLTAVYKDVYDNLHRAFDDYVATADTEPRHRVFSTFVQNFFTTFHQSSHPVMEATEERRPVRGGALREEEPV